MTCLLRSSAVLVALSLLAVGCHGASGDNVRAEPSRNLALTGKLTGMGLVRTDTDVKVADLVNGTIIYLDTIQGNASFNVNITYTGTDIGSVRITSNVPGYNSVKESVRPYALCGNKKTDFFPCDIMGPGNYTVTATPFSKSRLGSPAKAGTPITISFALLRTKPTPPSNQTSTPPSNQTSTPPSNKTSYFLPNLTYAYDALEPFIDTLTMMLHHDKHHGGAVTNLNKATENVTNKVPLVDLMEKALNATPIRNNGGSHYNHGLFWDEMAPFDTANKTKPSAQLAALLNSSFGGLEAMKTKFSAAAAPGTLFGSGWVWLCVNQGGDKLEIVGTPNQDNPLMRGVTKEIMFPILGLDVWEHAYYLKHYNLRANYVSNWWYVVNWDKVSANCAYVIANKTGVAVMG
jgi:superoxide dismutase, Fe-Mn family